MISHYLDAVEVVVALFLMLTLVLVAFPAVLLPISAAWYLRSRSEIRRVVRQVAEDHRLADTGDGGCGKIDDYVVEIRSSGTTAILEVSGLPPEIRLRTLSAFESVLADAVGPLGKRTHQPQLDRAIALGGRSDVAYAALGGGARDLLAQSSSRRILELRDGVLALRMERGITVARLHERLEEVLQLARSLDDGRTIPQRLRDNFLQSKSPRLAFANLKLLLSEHPGEEAREAAAGGLDSSSPRIRIRCAVFLSHLETLMSVATDRGASEEHRRAALNELEKHPAEYVDVLRKLLEAGGQDRRAALRRITRGRLTPLAPDVVALATDTHLRLWEDSQMGSRLAAALPAVGFGTEVEGALLVLTQSGRSQVAFDAVRGLREVGTINAVPRLCELRDNPRFPHSIRTMSSRAVDAIKVRNLHLEAGQVSVAELDGDQGGVSVATDGGGLGHPDVH